MRFFYILPLAALTACGSTSTSTFISTSRTVPTTINGVEVTADNILDIPNLTINAGQIIVDGEVVDQSGGASTTPGIGTETSAGSQSETTNNGQAGSNTLPNSDEVMSSLFAATDDFDRIVGDNSSPDTGLPGTAFNRIPTSGTASFEGPGFVNIYTRVENEDGSEIFDTIEVYLIGTASVLFDFADKTFDGGISEMTAIEIETFVMQTVDRKISIVDGVQSDPTNQPTALSATATGTLDLFGESYSINSSLNGLLRGTEPNAGVPVRAISLEGFDGAIAGSDLLVDIGIAADRNGGGAYLSQ